MITRENRTPTLTLAQALGPHPYAAHRSHRAALHRIAAAVEMASIGEQWVVTVTSHAVTIETVTESDAEIDRAMRVLREAYEV